MPKVVETTSITARFSANELKGILINAAGIKLQEGQTVRFREITLGALVIYELTVYDHKELI